MQWPCVYRYDLVDPQSKTCWPIHVLERKDKHHEIVLREFYPLLNVCNQVRTDQAFRASVRQGCLNGHIDTNLADASTLRLLRCLQIVGKRAPTATLLTPAKMSVLASNLGCDRLTRALNRFDPKDLVVDRMETLYWVAHTMLK